VFLGNPFVFFRLCGRSGVVHALTDRQPNPLQNGHFARENRLHGLPAGPTP